MRRVDAAVLEVDVAPREAERLAAPHPGREREPHGDAASVEALGPERLAQRYGLVERERRALGGARARHVNVAARVVLDEALLDGEVHDLAEDGVELVDAALRHAVVLAHARVEHVEQREREVRHEDPAEPALDLLELALVGRVREGREVLEELALLVPPPPELGHRQVLGVREPLLELAPVLLERPPRVRLRPVHRPLGGPQVPAGLGVPPEVVPDAVDLAALDLLDLAVARHLRHGRLPCALGGPWCGRGAAWFVRRRGAPPRGRDESPALPRGEF